MKNEKDYLVSEIKNDDYICCLILDDFEIYQYKRKNPVRDLKTADSQNIAYEPINVFSLEIQVNHPDKPPTKTGAICYSFKKISKKTMKNRLIGFKHGWEIKK